MLSRSLAPQLLSHTAPQPLSPCVIPDPKPHNLQPLSPSATQPLSHLPSSIPITEPQNCPLWTLNPNPYTLSPQPSATQALIPDPLTP